MQLAACAYGAKFDVVSPSAPGYLGELYVRVGADLEGMTLIRDANGQLTLP